MHRSGTSVLTRIVHEAGWPCPAPHGLFEDSRVNGLNDEILKEFGGSWARPPDELDYNYKKFSPRCVSLLMKFGPKAVIKDPRFCLTLPFWINDLEENDYKVIMIVRDPRAVAQSLKKRNGFSKEKSNDLYARYNRAWALRFPVHRAIDYDDILNWPNPATDELSRFLRCDLQPILDNVVDPAKNHFNEKAA